MLAGFNIFIFLPVLLVVQLPLSVLSLLEDPTDKKYTFFTSQFYMYIVNITIWNMPNNKVAMVFFIYLQ